MSQGYAVPPAIKNAFYDVIAREFNGEITPQAAVKQLADAAKAQY
jgi:glucose/mannose transport system substrate-binding protein